MLLNYPDSANALGRGIMGKFIIKAWDGEDGGGEGDKGDCEGI